MKKIFFLTALCIFTLFQSQAQVATKKTTDKEIAEKQNEPTIASADAKQKSRCCSSNPFILLGSE